MLTLEVDGRVLVIDRAEAQFLLLCVESFEREAERVAPAQLRRARLMRADLLRFASATSGARNSEHVEHTLVAGMNAQSITGLLTVAQVASYLEVSEAYVRRMAHEWAGERVGGRWLFPSSSIAGRIKERCGG